MLTMSCFSSLVANSWPVPGAKLNNVVDFLAWLSLIRFSGLQDMLPYNMENDIDENGALMTPDPNPDWLWSAGKLPIVKSLLLSLIQGHPAILPSAFLEAMDLVRTIFTEGSSEATSIIRDVEGDVEAVLITSFFLIIREFYDPTLTLDEFNAATNSRYARYVQPSPWRSAIEEFLDLDDEEQADLSGLKRARLGMLNDLLPDIQYFQVVMLGDLEAPVTAVYLGPPSMLSRDSLQDEHAFHEDVEDVEELEEVEEGVLSLTPMADEITILSRIPSTASDQAVDHGHEEPVRMLSSPIGLGVSGVSTGAFVDVPAPPQRIEAAEDSFSRIPTPVVASAPSTQVEAPLVEPAPPKRLRVTESPSPKMPTPIVASAPSATVDSPAVQPAPPRRVRATEYPFPKMPTPVVAAAPSAEAQPPVAEESTAAPASPAPSFTLPHPLSTVKPLTATLVNDSSDRSGQLTETRPLMDNVYAAARHASYREDREVADGKLSESSSVPESIALSLQEPMSTAADDALLGVPHPSVNSIASSMVQIEVVSPTPIIPRGVGVPDWVAEATQAAPHASRKGSDTSLFELPERPSRSATSTDAATLVGSVSFSVKGKPSFSTATSSATGSSESADWLSTYRRTPFPIRSVITAASIESESSGWFADTSAPSSPDFAPNVTKTTSPQGSHFQSKLSSFIRKLRLPITRSSTRETTTSDSSAPGLPAFGLPAAFSLVPVTVPSFLSSASSYVSPDSAERLMEHEVLVPVFASTEVEAAKEKRRWSSLGRWFGRRGSAEKLEKEN